MRHLMGEPVRRDNRSRFRTVVAERTAAMRRSAPALADANTSAGTRGG